MQYCVIVIILRLSVQPSFTLGTYVVWCPLTVCFKAPVTSALRRAEIKIQEEAPCQSLSAEVHAHTCGRAPNVLKPPPVTEPGDFTEVCFYVFMQICHDR